MPAAVVATAVIGITGAGACNETVPPGFDGRLQLFGASLLVRPVWPVRLHAGVSYNLLGPGLRAGATVIPFHFAFVPTASIEYGHTFDAKAVTLVSKFARLSPLEKSILDRIGYDYVSVQLGLETGSPRSFAWFIRGGVAWVWPRLPGFDAALRSQNPDLTSTTPKIRVAVPAVNTGFYLYF